MEPRLEMAKANPEAMRAMARLQRYVGNTGLDERLLWLIEIRASQINGCGY